MPIVPRLDGCASPLPLLVLLVLLLLSRCM